MMEKKRDSGFYLTVKRGLDILLSGLALLVLWPVLLIVALLVRRDGGPAFFAQTRIGRHGKPIAMYKFRSMKPGADKLENFLTPEQLAQYKREFKLDPDPRITKIGQFLRKSSLDELPQLWNILKGDMSLIGPRPALWNQYDLMELRDKYGASMIRPGLSGWAQVNGRDYLSQDLEKKARRDGEYANNVSFAFDLKCFLLTIVKVFNRQGIKEGADENTTEAGK